jgi:deoxyadenosine/deoxycytidine kinase
MRIAIDGNIAAGKSTLFSSIATRASLAPHVTLFPEPLDEWGEILELYFRDRKSWALPLTLDILRGFYKSYTTEHAIVERNPYTCRYVFTQILYYDGHISKDDMELIDQYMTTFGWKPDAVIYIDVLPGTCHDRMNERARRGETESVSYEEIRTIDHLYNKMFEDQLKDIPVHRMTQRQGESMQEFHDRVGDLIESLLMISNEHATPKT